MKRAATWVLPLAAAAALLASGCDTRSDPHANAPGSPATGNPTQAAAPQAPDGPPGGPSGVKGSAPHTGSSGGDAMPGTTGSGTLNAGNTAQPGVGLNGGLGAGSGSGLSGSFPANTTATTGAMGNSGGSPNTSPDSAVGRR